MIITTAYNSTDFDRIMEISDACYEGVERPPRETMKDMVEVCDIFLAKRCLMNDPDSPSCENHSTDPIVGFALVRTVVHPYIWSIAVAKKFQGRGVGGNLLREIIKWYTLQKAQEIKLHVHEDNPAQKLYWDYGFRVKSVEEGYYMPKDGLVMRRELP
jgi:ribosomal protein S18 acetylase RimI-like enzyme